MLLIEMEEANSIDMSCDMDKFCVSSVLTEVAAIGMERFVSSWNFHPVSVRIL